MSWANASRDGRRTQPVHRGGSGRRSRGWPVLAPAPVRAGACFEVPGIPPGLDPARAGSVPPLIGSRRARGLGFGDDLVEVGLVEVPRDVDEDEARAAEAQEAVAQAARAMGVQEVLPPG